MRIQTRCESCFHDFSVSPNPVGKRVKCSECGEVVRVPADDGDDEPVGTRRSSVRRQKVVGRTHFRCGLSWRNNS